MDQADLNVIASPMQSMRDVFDLMPTDTAGAVGHRGDPARRGARAPSSSGRASLLASARRRARVSARRQVEACMRQCDDLVGDEGFFATYAGGARTKDGASLPDGPAGRARRGRRASRRRLRRPQGVPRRAPAPTAPPRRTPSAASATSSPAATSSARPSTSRRPTRGARRRPSASTPRCAAPPSASCPAPPSRRRWPHLDEDPAYRLDGTDELQRWMQTKADEVMDLLDGTHFDIPAPVRTIECRIAPTHTGGIYYTGPSEDFTRPGRMWWSVPKGVETFGTWAELSTVYHEGVPGHHLQVAQTTYRAELLNRWRRMLCWVSGHGEGWALYAERLMVELGFMEDPGNYLGFLDAQSLRAARVVLDIGIHCGFEAPGGGRRRRVDLRQGVAVPRRPRQQRRGVAALRARPLPRLAGPGPELQDRRAHLDAAARRDRCARRATRSTPRRSTGARSTSARSVSTSSSRRCAA